MCNIIPGILEREWSEIEKKIELVKPFTKVIHIDIIDGKFAPNTTFLNPEPFKKYTKNLPAGETGIFFEVHMMVENPIQYLKPFASAGFKRFLGHIERMPDQVKFVAEAQTLGEVGLALDGPTPLSEIKVFPNDLDTILFMTTKAGFSGQDFNSQLLEKVRKMHEIIPLNDRGELFPIETDGGINDQTIKLVRESGAKRFAVTSFLFNSQNLEEQYKKLQDLIK